MRTKGETITFRCPAVLRQALESIAAGLDRSLSWVICSKLKEAVSDEIKAQADGEIDDNDLEDRRK